MELGLDHHLMDIIQHDHPNDCESCCIKMLTERLDGNTATSWEDIICVAERLLLCGEYTVVYHIHSSKGMSLPRNI